MNDYQDIQSVTFDVMLEPLVIRRYELERKNSTNPDEWRKLSEDFAEIGAIANATRCRKLAEHFEGMNGRNS